jgi:hypothetical protein
METSPQGEVRLKEDGISARGTNATDATGIGREGGEPLPVPTGNFKQISLTNSTIDQRVWDSISTSADGSVVDPNENNINDRRDIHYVKVANNLTMLYFYLESYDLTRAIDRSVHVAIDTNGDGAWDYDVVWYGSSSSRVRVYRSNGNTIFNDNSGNYVDYANGRVEFGVPFSVLGISPTQTIAMYTSTRSGTAYNSGVVDAAPDYAGGNPVYKSYTNVPESSLHGFAIALVASCIWICIANRSKRNGRVSGRS